VPSRPLLQDKCELYHVEEDFSSANDLAAKEAAQLEERQELFLKRLRIAHDVDIPQGDATGVIIAQAGRFGGWSLYIQNGKPMYTYNFLELSSSKVASAKSLSEGKVAVSYEFAYDRGGLGMGGKGTIYVNDDTKNPHVK
jgi:hypothetical protein